jgi:hypothetical protein
VITFLEALAGSVVDGGVEQLTEDEGRPARAGFDDSVHDPGKGSVALNESGPPAAINVVWLGVKSVMAVVEAPATTDGNPIPMKPNTGTKATATQCFQRLMCHLPPGYQPADNKADASKQPVVALWTSLTASGRLSV